MTHFSGFSLLKNALSGHKNWPEQWPDKQPKDEYDVIIVGAGGHGLGAAYYLAKEHGITNVAVIEKGWLGGGNTGRNTTIIRSNYLYDESAKLYDHALDLWENLSTELNYNVMYSKRGVMMLAHNVHDVQSFQRHIHANRLNGVDNQWLTPKQAKEFCPPLNISPDARYPSWGPPYKSVLAPRVMMRSPGVMPVQRQSVASTSFRIARLSRSGAEPMARSRVSIPRKALSRLRKWQSLPLVTRRSSWTAPVCACPWKAIRFRRLCPSRSSRSSPAW